MRFVITPKILSDFPDLFIGVIVTKGIANVIENSQIQTLLQETQNTLQTNLQIEEIATHPHIVPWREAYQKFGADPRDFRPSNEALVRSVLNGRSIRSINPLVDLYNVISLKYILTLGGEDLDKISGDLLLDYAEGTESFVPLGKTENDPPLKGEVVYKDDLGTVCRRWNWREGDRTKLTKETKNTILVIEGLPPIKQEIVQTATLELEKLITKFCQGKNSIFFLDKNNSKVLF